MQWLTHFPTLLARAHHFPRVQLGFTLVTPSRVSDEIDYHATVAEQDANSSLETRIRWPR